MSNRGGYFRAAILENHHANQPSEWIDLILPTKARKAMRIQEPAHCRPQHRSSSRRNTKQMKSRERVVVLALVCSALTAGVHVDASGLGALNYSSICVSTEQEIHALMLNDAQLQSGIEGNVVLASDCKQLVQANVLNYRSEEDQKALCGNSCFATLTKKYQTLLINDCFASKDGDEAANGRLQAAAYQIACQTTTAGKYCIPMLADLVANAGTGFDLCADIVKDLGCCFQSYRQYMLFGTAASIATLDDAQTQCTKDGVKGLDKACPCGTGNAYNHYAMNDTTICSDGLVLSVASLALTAVLTTTMLLLSV